MTKRYYLSDIIGDGLSTETAFRPAIADYASDFVADIPSQANGSPLNASAIIAVEAQDHTGFSNLPNIDQLPDMNPRELITTLPPQDRNQIIDFIQSRNIQGLGNPFEISYEDIGKALNPNFNIDNFGVSP